MPVTIIFILRLDNTVTSLLSESLSTGMMWRTQGGFEFGWEFECDFNHDEWECIVSAGSDQK
jgi:hypothetical protein